MKRIVRAIAVAAVGGLALALGGCGSAQPDAGKAGNDVLRIGNFQDVTSWDPANADIGFDGPYLSAVYDGLVSLNTKSKPVPELATSWDWSPDRLTLTMHLRQGVTFTDGEKFDAAAAIANLKHLKSGTRSAPTYQHVTRFQAVNPGTLRIHLSQPDGALLYFMGLGRSWMAAPHAIADGSIKKSPVGTGPYQLDGSVSRDGAKYVFTNNQRYWKLRSPEFRKVVLYPINNTTARFDAMLSGQINVVYGGPKLIPKAHQHKWNIAKMPAMWTGIQFSDRTGKQLPPLKHKKVRQAIAYAFKNEALLKSVGIGAGVATNQLFPDGSKIYDKDLNGRYRSNMAKARKLLAEAGYANGFSVTMPMSPIYQAWQPAAQQTFDRLGIHVTWKNMTYAEYFALASSFPMYIASVSMDSNPVATLVDQLTTPQWYNPHPAVKAYPQVETLVKRVRDARGKEQTRLLRKLNTKLVNLAWWDVWYQSENIYFSDKGITMTPITGMMFPTLKFIHRG